LAGGRRVDAAAARGLVADLNPDRSLSRPSRRCRCRRCASGRGTGVRFGACGTRSARNEMAQRWTTRRPSRLVLQRHALLRRQSCRGVHCETSTSPPMTSSVIAKQCRSQSDRNFSNRTVIWIWQLPSLPARRLSPPLKAWTIAVPGWLGIFTSSADTWCITRPYPPTNLQHSDPACYLSLSHPWLNHRFPEMDTVGHSEGVGVFLSGRLFDPASSFTAVLDLRSRRFPALSLLHGLSARKLCPIVRLAAHVSGQSDCTTQKH